MRTQDQSGAVALTRRTLLKGAGAVAVGLALPGSARGDGRRTGWHLRRSSYRPLIGEAFRGGGRRVKVRLVDIEDLNRHQAGSDHAFALQFAAPQGAPPLPSRIPTKLIHPALGRF